MIDMKKDDAVWFVQFHKHRPTRKLYLAIGHINEMLVDGELLSISTFSPANKGIEYYLIKPQDILGYCDDI